MIYPVPAYKTLLITGVSGFIGRVLARHFNSKGYLVYGIDRIPSENAPLSDLQAYEQLDLPSPHLTSLLSRWHPDVLIHSAGRASVPVAMVDPRIDFHDGPLLTFELLEMLRQNLPSCAFILLSSAAVYGNPTVLPVSEGSPIQPVSPYGYHKWQSEIIGSEFARVYGLNTSSVRIFSAYGPGLRRQVIWDICKKSLLKERLVLQGTGNESRDFIHVADIAVALETLISHAPMTGEVYNLGSGREVTIRELSQIILSTLELDIEPLFDGLVPPGTPLNWRSDMTSLGNLGFAPLISLEQGIKSFVQWCQAELLTL
ncbi:MAG: NAD-dependent epimerase/dehydratase family protein [Mariniphaga sp.]